MTQLVPMTETDFQTFLKDSIADYAQDHVNAGNWSAETALQNAEREFHTLLPDGLASKDSYLYMIKDEATGTNVGILWFVVCDWGGGPQAFVFDVKVFDAFQRRGYGMQAFQALEEKVKNLGLHSIALHVFGQNYPARTLYEKLGYRRWRSLFFAFIAHV